MSCFVASADFDFSQAGWYRKTKKLAFADVRRAERVEEIVTYNSHGIETRNTAQPGDYILKGSSDRYGGDGYIVTADRFDEIYEIDPDTHGHYRNKDVRRALLTLEPITLQASWGETQRIGAGGVIVEAGRHIYGVDRFSFIKNYGRCDDAADHVLFVDLKLDLMIQRALAESLNCQNHLRDMSSGCRICLYFYRNRAKLPVRIAN